jgi:hypothetical protein
MIDLKESIAGAEAILEKLWNSATPQSTSVIKDTYAQAYGYLKQGVTMYLEEQAKEREEATGERFREKRILRMAQALYDAHAGWSVEPASEADWDSLPGTTQAMYETMAASALTTIEEEEGGP